MAVLVPRVFHRIWLGGSMPPEYETWGKTWLDHHPGWKMKLWTEENLPPSRFPDLIERAVYYRTRSNIYRYEILLREGGVYIDSDFECLKNLEPLIHDAEWFAVHVSHGAYPGLLANGLIGCVPGHKITMALVDEMRSRFDPGLNLNLGPHYFTEIVMRFAEPRILESRLFFPYLWTELHRQGEAFPEAYAVHHWGSHRYDASKLPIKDLPPSNPRF